MDQLTHGTGAGLTTREKQILNYISVGLSSKQIAAVLYISINTVSNHRRNMLLKRGAKSSAELVRSVLRSYGE
jgi:two-component system secretion response regulator SsrB